MTSRERVRAAFNHQEADRVPVFEIHIDSKPASEILGHFAPVGYGGAVRGKLLNEMTIAGQVDEFQRMHMEGRLELCRELELDIIRAFPYPKNPPVPKLVGENTWRLEDAEHGRWSVHKFDPETDAYAEVDSSAYRNGLDEVREMVEEMEAREPGLDGISFANLEWVKETAPDLCAMGWADVAFPHTSWLSVFLEGMALDPELIDRWMAVNLRQVLLQLEAQLEMGADLILGGQDFCDSRGPMCSPKHFERFIAPGLREISKMCHRHGVPYLRHEDGSIAAVEKEFLLRTGIDGWHAIEPAAGMDIHHFKKKYGKDITLAGNIDCASTLLNGTREEIRAEVRDRIRSCAPGGGYIVSSSNSIHNDIPGSNYLIMREAVEEYGYYPIEGSVER